MSEARVSAKEQAKLDAERAEFDRLVAEEVAQAEKAVAEADAKALAEAEAKAVAEAAQAEKAVAEADAKALAEAEAKAVAEAAEASAKAAVDLVARKAAADDAVKAAHKHAADLRKAADQAERDAAAAVRAARPARAWVISKHDIPNMQDGNKRMIPGQPVELDLDGWAHNQIEAGFFTIVPAPA